MAGREGRIVSTKGMKKRTTNNKVIQNTKQTIDSFLLL